MRGWFDCLEGQYKNRVGKSRKENQSINIKIGNNYATCIAFKFRRGAPRLFDCGHRTTHTYLLKATIIVHLFFYL